MGPLFDTSPLLERPSQEEVEAFRRSRRPTRVPARDAAVVVVATLGTGAFLSVLTLLSGEPPRWTRTVLAVVWVVCGGACALALLASSRLLDPVPRVGWERRLRLDRFAHANGMHYAADSGEPPYRGVVFGVGGSRRVVDRLWSQDGLLRDCGAYEYSVGSSRHSTTHRWYFVAVALPRPLPRLLLDARANDALAVSSLPATLEGSSRLELGAPFDDHFRLHCADQDRVEIFRVLTPDVMALLIDRAQTLDLEVVDDWLLLYSRFPHALTDPAWWERVGRVVQTVGARVVDRAARQLDDVDGGLPASTVLHGPDGPAPDVRRPWRRRALRVAAVGIWVVLLASAVLLWLLTGGPG